MGGNDIQLLVEQCKCGHDRCTHYPKRVIRDYEEHSGNVVNKEVPGVGGCLAAHCDCVVYKYKVPK